MDGACVEKQSWQIRASEYQRCYAYGVAMILRKNCKLLWEELVDKGWMKYLLLARIEIFFVKNSVKLM